MNIAQVHNYYQIRGGEDQVVELERQMLEHNGHTVTPFYANSNDIKTYSPWKKLLFFYKALHNRDAAIALIQLVKENNIDIVHIHNIWPLISPSIFHALRVHKIPYVQTLHNFRMIVPDGSFSKQKRKINAYRNSVLLTQLYKFIGTKMRLSPAIKKGDFIVLNDFSKKVYARYLPEKNLHIKGNFLPDIQKSTPDPQNYFLYLGRLSKEKGVETLIQASLKANVSLKIAGTGPQETFLKQKYASSKIEFLGVVNGDEKHHLFSEAKAAIFPSECQENFPISLMEAAVAGTPVIASNVGGLPEMITHGKTGLLFKPGNAADLAEKLLWVEKNPEDAAKMGIQCAINAKKKYSEKNNYEKLLSIYQKVYNSKIA